jgi:hypothetical protein
VPKKTSSPETAGLCSSLSRVLPAGSNFRLFHLAFIATLLYAALCLGLDTWTGVREILVSTDFGPAGRLVDPISTADGETTRNLVITTAPDGRWWIMHAEKMAREGVFRIRETQSDNPPTGREVHWSSLQMWNLIALSKAMEIFPKAQGLSDIEWAALFIGPVTWVIFLVFGLFVAWKAFGKEVALAWILCMISARSVLHYFRAGEADHHGLVALFAALGVLLLAGGRVGLFKKGGRPESAWWFAGAGISTAMGLWVSAATQLPILFATALGGILATWIATRSLAIRVNHNSWRVWGFTGALVSLLLYAVEYFPSHMGWRLEVNHPLYSLAWLAGGELLCRITSALGAHAIPKLQWRDRIVLGFCAIAILLPAAFIVFGGERVFVVSDRFLYALHDYFINEFMTLAAVAKSTGYHYALFSYSFTFAALLVVALGIFRRGVPKEQIAVLVFASLPVLVMTLLAIRQIRWSGTASAMVIPMVLAAMWLIFSQPAPRWRAISAWAVLLLATLPTSVAIIFRVMDAQDRGNMVDQSIVPSVITRDICQRLAATSSGKRLVVLASPSTSTEIIYYGGAKAVGTLYWENLEGLRKAAEIYSLRDENEVLRRIQEFGVTHILLFSWDSFGQRYVRLQRGLGKDDEARDGFIPALLEGTRPQPTWLTPLYYPLPEEYKLGNDQWVRIYAVAPGQSRAEWFHGIAIYQLDAGKEDLAERSLREAVALEPGKVDSRIALLLLLATQQRPAELAAEVQSALKNMGVNGHNLIQQAALDLAKSNQNSAADALLKALSDNHKF